MIIRAMGLGFVLWLISMIVFRFAGHMFFEPGKELLPFVATPVIAGIVTFICLKLLKEAPGDEAEAAIGLALPGMLLDAVVVHEFDVVMPYMSPSMETPFAALMLLAYGAVLFVGLSMTKLAPQDERV
ncbi:DUF5367 family protein [Terricaulis sp.]|uniref:DUF5367 family protein n=1 Tax=Terricaulis sp. TaxID=2768686 RepID=UPI003783FB69